MISSAIAGTLAVYIWERHQTPGAKPFAGLMVSVGLWALFNALEILSIDPAAKSFWNCIKTLGVVSSPVFWLLFSGEFTNHRFWLKPGWLALISLVPLLTLVFRVVLPVDQYIPIPLVDPAAIEVPLAVKIYSAWFWISTVYSFTLLLLGSIYLILSLKITSPWYSRQVISVLISILLPWIGNGLSIFQIWPYTLFDFTPIAFAISGCALVWGIFRFGLLDMIPVARAAVVENMVDGVIIYDHRERVVDANPAAAKLLDLPGDVLIGQPIRHVLSRFPQLVDHYDSPTQAQFEVSVGEGDDYRSYDLRLSPLFDSKQRLARHLVVVRDITAYKYSEQELEKSHAILLATLEATADGLLVVGGRGKPLRYNRKFIEMWRITDEIVKGGVEQDLMSFLLDRLVNPAAFYRLMNKLSSQPDAESYDVLELKDGRVFERFSRPQRIGDLRVGRVWSFRDITEQRRAEEKLRYLSIHDILTGLYNRVYFEEEVSRLENSRQFPISMIMVDVDDLKRTNDNYGHQAGDALLRKAADILRQACRAEDMVARIGGDEFGILLPFSDEQVSDNAMERIRNMVAMARVGDSEITLSLSIGSATAHSGGSLRKVLRMADKAMYQAKDSKRKKRPQSGKMEESLLR